MAQMQPARPTEGARRSLPMGISESMSDDAQRLLDELHVRQDAFEQQAQLVRQLQTALQRAQATNQELALVADRVTDAILICDAQRCISWVNPAFTRLTGFSLTECHGQLPEELLSGPHTDAAIVAQINQSLAQGASVERLEVCHHRKDGEPFWVRRSVQPIHGPDGQINRYIEVLTDISDTRRSAAEHARRLEVEVSLAAKMEFLSRMSHSMRSPLNAILGFTQLLNMADAASLTEPQQRHLQHIHTAGHQMLSLLDQALEFAQLDDKAVGIRPQRVELAVLLKEIRAALEDQAAAHDITVVVDCPSLTVWADANHTRAILMNLAVNAIQYSPHGSTVWLTGKAAADERLGVIEVRDQGFGIDAGDLQRLFQPFTRLESATRSPATGNGLGLAVSQRLAELMHGRIDVTSTLGHGSVFALRLPLAEMPGSGRAGAQGRSQEPAVMLPPLRVVHIEDNALNRSLVEAVFAAYPQVRLFSAENAAEGMAAIENTRPDVALVDINLPDGSGLDLCRRLRAQTEFRKLPLIALSADALPDHIARALQTGFNHYLVKPLQIPRLLGILATLPSAQAAPPTN
ncbi:ATP-binding protein [Aquabacterium sp.]|uniref:hybrid sensor histidine kinase/response regulator n=1 Tax=Aquabacterium TaxID=92793 RepID=UPI001E135927|nr:ATP-binding protein [Aquabacterium sp.]MBT9608698.1 response regulator [Aquabacterium sp.]